MPAGAVPPAGDVATGFARATAERSIGRDTTTAGATGAAAAGLCAAAFIAGTTAAVLPDEATAAPEGVAVLAGTAPCALVALIPSGPLPAGTAFGAAAAGGAAFMDGGVAAGGAATGPEFIAGVAVDTAREVCGPACGLCAGGGFGAFGAVRAGCPIGCVRVPCRSVGGLACGAFGEGFVGFGGSGRAGAGGGRPSFGGRFIGGPSSPSPVLFADCGDASASPLPAPGKSFEKMLIAEHQR
ncbi:MAG TPA: hypothetical protein VK841_10895 [Polyangiaceae bacterium]|jgi:hypothetical protein|nr:hypothetical protein [Polyangiaceae bacterium]